MEKSNIYIYRNPYPSICLDEAEYNLVIDKLKNPRSYRETDKFFNLRTFYKLKTKKPNVYVLDQDVEDLLDDNLIYGGSTKMVDGQIRTNKRGKTNKKYFFYLSFEKELKFLLTEGTEVIKIDSIFNQDTPRIFDERSFSKVLSLSKIRTAAERELFLSSFYHFLYKENLKQLIVLASFVDADIYINDDLYNFFLVGEETAKILAALIGYDCLKPYIFDEYTREELEKFHLL